MKKSIIERKSAWKIKGVLFDFDGTLTQAGLIDFQSIKKAVGCSQDMAVLEYIESIADDEERKKAFSILEEAELKAARQSQPNDGAIELLEWLKAKNIPFGILTRNAHENVEVALENFDTVFPEDFICIVSRDSDARPKPYADGVLLASQEMQLDPGELLVVGDYHFDIEAGRRANALTSFITNNNFVSDTGDADFVIDTLDELYEIVELGVPVAGGKLPNDILEKYLSSADIQGQGLVVGPAPGEDCAVLEVNHDRLLSVTSDPITFTTDRAARYAVTVNANDIATSGAIPEWFFMTLLMPAGSSYSEAGKIILETSAICREMNITVSGGHTEFTDAVVRPVISGTMIGLVEKESLKIKSNMREGDDIIMAGPAGVEGTAILANDFENLLSSKGVSRDLISSGRAFIDSLSIVAAAGKASEFKSVQALHDVTEGGIATALEELSLAGGHCLNIRPEDIIVMPETEAFCDALGLHPMGIIGSGCLLLTAGKEEREDVLSAIEGAGIVCRVIGSVGEQGRGVSGVDWPQFPADEITKLF